MGEDGIFRLDLKEVEKYGNLIKAVFDAIENEYQRLCFNAYQKEVDSPFKNSGASYKNNIFEVCAYNWDKKDSIYNFKYKDIFLASWYKHSHRGLVFWKNNGEPLDAEFVNAMLTDCLNALHKEFRKNRGKNEIL